MDGLAEGVKGVTRTAAEMKSLAEMIKASHSQVLDSIDALEQSMQTHLKAIVREVKNGKGEKK